jgi:azurin
MSVGKRERVFGSRKLGPKGESTGVTLPKDLLDEAEQYDQIPSNPGDEAEFVLVENRDTGDAELKLVKKDRE